EFNLSKWKLVFQFQFFHLFLNFISFLLHIILSIQKTARFKNKTCGLPDYYEILIPVLFSSICVNGLFSTKISIMLPGLTIWEYCVFNPTTGIKEIKKHTNIITKDPFANPRMPPAALLMNPIPGRLLILLINRIIKEKIIRTTIVTSTN